MIEKLEELHLSPSEAKVYVALVKLGQTSAGAIIKESNLHRSVVYESLHKLVDRKMVFQLDKNKIAYFQATDPAAILENTFYQEQIALEVIPELKKLIDTGLPQITIYEGAESYRQYWLNAYKKLPIGSIDYVSGSIGKKFQDYMGLLDKESTAIRVKRKIKWQMIIYEKDYDYELELLKKYPKLHEYRLIDKKMAKNGNFNIFNEDTLVLHSAIEPLLIEIKNKSLAKIFKDTFDILWEIGKPVK